jgi:hypothetical protein
MPSAPTESEKEVVAAKGERLVPGTALGAPKRRRHAQGQKIYRLDLNESGILWS